MWVSQLWQGGSRLPEGARRGVSRRRARQVALVEPPDFSYGLVVQGGDLTFLPGLESWLNSFIKTSLLQPYILPDGVTVPLAPGCGREACGPPSAPPGAALGSWAPRVGAFLPCVCAAQRVTGRCHHSASLSDGSTAVAQGAAAQVLRRTGTWVETLRRTCAVHSPAPQQESRSSACMPGRHREV